jgi:ATPase subunit of ABC transporter with duplicated ATPase domains
MSASLVVKDLAAGHGARALFAELDLVVAPGDVIGLVGVNGAGKSTLLRLLAGLATPAHGEVSLHPPSASIGYLAQEPERRAGESVHDFLARRTGVTAAQVRMDAAAEALGTADSDADTYAEALESWLELGGADFEDRVDAVLAEVGLSAAPATDMTALSGGQAARAALAALLLSRFDVYLLDEPTNDLDLDGLDRLERFVSNLRAGVVVVSHDREFLARTVTAVLELDLAQQRVSYFGGGYDAYLAEREVARRHAREAYEQFADKKAALGERARTQRDWMTVGVRNARRKMTDNDKIGRNARTETSEKQAAKARQTQRMIERMDVVEEPRKEWQLHLQIAAAPRSGSVVAVLDKAVVRRGSFTLGPVSVQLDWADRVAITGANGSGKTTLLAALLERIALDSGRASLGAGVVVGEVDQARQLFIGDDTLVAVFERLVPELVTADLRTLLAKFGLRADHVDRPCTSLSPGERTRAALALLQARGVNLLVLDEPTNHLDLPAIEQLESALADYQGTLLLVTHDRRMLAAVPTTRHWNLADGVLSQL